MTKTITKQGHTPTPCAGLVTLAWQPFEVAEYLR